MTNFGGAFDLSSLNKPAQSGDQVSSWLVRADENTLRKYLELSERVPVVMLITDSSVESQRVRAALVTIIESAKGHIAGLEVDIETSPQLAAAVAVNQAPAGLALLAGQPAPLFKGEAKSEQLVEILGRVLQAAAQNGIRGTVSLAAEDSKKPLRPEHLAAIDLVEQGDLHGAKAQFEKIAIEYPSDLEIRAGLHQVQLLIRLSQGETSEVFGRADQAIASGNPKLGFGILLDEFEKNFEDRPALRERLIELFSVVGESDASVLEARRRLASLLF